MSTQPQAIIDYLTWTAPNSEAYEIKYTAVFTSQNEIITPEQGEIPDALFNTYHEMINNLCTEHARQQLEISEAIQSVRQPDPFINLPLFNPTRTRTA